MDGNDLIGRVWSCATLPPQTVVTRGNKYIHVRTVLLFFLFFLVHKNDVIGLAFLVLCNLRLPCLAIHALCCLLLSFYSVDENDLIGLAKGVGPDLLKVAPAALAAAPAALPLLAGALGVPGESLYLAGLASFAAGKIEGDVFFLRYIHTFEHAYTFLFLVPV